MKTNTILKLDEKKEVILKFDEIQKFEIVFI